MNFPVLKTERLELRQLTQQDVDAVYAIFSDSDVVRYYDLAPFEEKKQAARIIDFFQQRWQSRAGIRWGIYFSGENACIGTCGLNSWDKNMHSATIGYDLNKAHWGKGIATEAVSEILNTTFSKESPFDYINRIQADTIPGNDASERVLIKLGFKEEGLRRQSGYWKNRYHDLKCFGLLREEFVPQK